MKPLLVIIALLMTQTMSCHNYFAQLHQLQGTWKMQQKDNVLYESWKSIGPKQLSGKAYKLHGADTVVLEEVILELDTSGIYYRPLVAENQGRVSFKLISAGDKKFVFENKAHDFPQRVIYQFITKDSLHAWIEGTVNGVEKRSDYYYRRN